MDSSDQTLQTHREQIQAKGEQTSRLFNQLENKIMNIFDSDQLPKPEDNLETIKHPRTNGTPDKKGHSALHSLRGPVLQKSGLSHEGLENQQKSETLPVKRDFLFNHRDLGLNPFANVPRLAQGAESPDSKLLSDLNENLHEIVSNSEFLRQKRGELANRRIKEKMEREQAASSHLQSNWVIGLALTFVSFAYGIGQ